MKILPYQYKANKVCSRCVMDDTVNGISFDAKAECTFCNIHDDLEKKIPLNEETPPRLQALVDKKDDLLLPDDIEEAMDDFIEVFNKAQEEFVEKIDYFLLCSSSTLRLASRVRHAWPMLSFRFSGNASTGTTRSPSTGQSVSSSG